MKKLTRDRTVDPIISASVSWLTYIHLSAAKPVAQRAHNAIERLHEEFKRRIKTQGVPPSAEAAAMLFWALLAPGQINIRKVDGWQTLAANLIGQPIDLAA
jgi:putative transposase